MHFRPIRVSGDDIKEMEALPDSVVVPGIDERRRCCGGIGIVEEEFVASGGGTNIRIILLRNEQCSPREGDPSGSGCPRVDTACATNNISCSEINNFYGLTSGIAVRHIRIISTDSDVCRNRGRCGIWVVDLSGVDESWGGG